MKSISRIYYFLRGTNFTIFFFFDFFREINFRYFHGGYEEVILFDFWRINTLGGLIGSMVACFVLGILYEFIKSYREYWMRGAFQTVRYNQVIFFFLEIYSYYLFSTLRKVVLRAFS